MDPARAILLNLLRMNLEHAWELLQDDHCDIAIEHLQMATEQAGQIKYLAAQRKLQRRPQQKLLEV